MSKNNKMIEPFSENQVRIDERGNKLISYGVSSYGYDVRCSNEFKVFTNIHSAIVDPLNAQIQIRLNLLQGLKEFSIRLLEIKNGEIQDNYYKIVRSESCMLSDIKYECIVLKRFREKEKRETLYYLIPDLDYMFLKIIDSGPERNQKLELLEILSLG